MTQMWVIKAFEAADGSGSNTSSRLFQLLELGHAGAWRWRGREPKALPVPVCRRAAGSSLPWGCARCSAGTGQLRGGCSKGSACSWCKFKPRALLPWESSCPVKHSGRPLGSSRLLSTFRGGTAALVSHLQPLILPMWYLQGYNTAKSHLTRVADVFGVPLSPWGVAEGLKLGSKSHVCRMEATNSPLPASPVLTPSPGLTPSPVPWSSPHLPSSPHHLPCPLPPRPGCSSLHGNSGCPRSLEQGVQAGEGTVPGVLPHPWVSSLRPKILVSCPIPKADKPPVFQPQNAGVCTLLWKNVKTSVDVNTSEVPTASSPPLSRAKILPKD